MGMDHNIYTFGDLFDAIDEYGSMCDDSKKQLVCYVIGLNSLASLDDVIERLKEIWK